MADGVSGQEWSRDDRVARASHVEALHDLVTTHFVEWEMERN